MAGIQVTRTYPYVLQTYQGIPIRKARLAISGLVAGAGNVIPHGLPATPVSAAYAPGVGGLWGETQAADATNLYVTVGTGGATSGTVYVEY